MIKEITTTELATWQVENRPFQLVDVRTAREHEAGHLEGDLHLPMEDIFSNFELLEEDSPVVLYCRSGVRSYHAVYRLQEEFGFENLYNLKRGILAWEGKIIR